MTVGDWHSRKSQNSIVCYVYGISTGKKSQWN